MALLLQPNIMINLPRESAAGVTINSDEIDPHHLTSNNPVKNGKAIEGIADDTFQGNKDKDENSFIGTHTDFPHTYLTIPQNRQSKSLN